MDFAVRGLALRLQVQLKPKSGPTPLIPTIVAAILAARDPSLGARGACRLVPDLDGNSAHSRVAKLVRKVLPLLADVTRAEEIHVLQRCHSIGRCWDGRSFYYRQYNGSIEKQWECP